MVLGLGAPAGWLAWRSLVEGVDPTTDIVAYPAFYLYITFGTSLAFGLFAWRIARSEAQLHRANARLSTIAVTDELTQLRNALFFRTRAEELWHESYRAGEPFAVIVLDLDHFKRVNDKHGHPAGDEVLRELGERIRHHVRNSDTPARVGGEEFAVLLPRTGLSEATEVAERLRASVAAEPFPTATADLCITTSVGVASSARGRGVASFRELYAAADAALYRAKRGGRNRVVAAAEFE